MQRIIKVMIGNNGKLVKRSGRYPNKSQKNSMGFNLSNKDAFLDSSTFFGSYVIVYWYL
jgi:hypothetical protein